jgi:hypothetical protein
MTFPAPPTAREDFEPRLDAPDDVEDLRAALAAAERRAVTAERECIRLREVCNRWGSNYDSWVTHYQRVWEQRNALHDAVSELLFNGGRVVGLIGAARIRAALDSVPFDREADHA